MIGRENDAGRTARVTIAFKGAPDGETHPRAFVPGDVIRGELAEAEVAAGRAAWTAPPKIETKAPAGPLPDGPESVSSSARPAPAKGGKTSKRRVARRGSSS